MSGNPFRIPPLEETLAGGPPTAARASLLESQDAMNGDTLRQKVVITNPQGLHMRPATAFAQLAMRFQSSVQVGKDNKSVNGKSPLELIFLNAPCGTELTIEVSGPDAPEAVKALAELLHTIRFDE